MLLTAITREDLDQLVFIDETASNAAMAPRYGRAPRSKRAVGSCPKSKRGRSVTVIGALTLEGLVATMTIEGAADGDAFRAYVREVLVPHLKPGQIVVMDNVSTHKVDGVLSAMYMLRKAGARTLDGINQVLKAIGEAITPSDALNWFLHCNYGNGAAQLA